MLRVIEAQFDEACTSVIEPFAEPIDSESGGFKRSLASALLALGVVLTGLAIWLGVTEWIARPTRHYKAPVPGISISVLGFVRDLKFRPDGRQLAVLQQRDRKPDGIATILDFPSGTVVRNIFDAASGVMAWSSDGAKLAVGHTSANRVDVWDARSWRLDRSLSMRVRAVPGDDVYAIGLDCEGNVYASEGAADRGPLLSTDPSLNAWWPGSTIPQTVGSLGDPFDLAVGCLADGTRVVISYDRGVDADTVEVWQVRRPAHGQSTVTKQYVLPGLHLSRIALAQDGTTLVAQDENAVRVYRLGADRADLIRRLDAKLESRTFLSRARPAISPNNQFIAYSCGGRASSHLEEAHVVVARIPSGEIVFAAKQGAPLAFSPNSKLLAVWNRETIIAYTVEGR
jgi:hypothetical protein